MPCPADRLWVQQGLRPKPKGAQGSLPSRPPTAGARRPWGTPCGLEGATCLRTGCCALQAPLGRAALARDAPVYDLQAKSPRAGPRADLARRAEQPCAGLENADDALGILGLVRSPGLGCLAAPGRLRPAKPAAVWMPYLWLDPDCGPEGSHRTLTAPRAGGWGGLGRWQGLGTQGPHRQLCPSTLWLPQGSWVWPAGARVETLLPAAALRAALANCSLARLGHAQPAGLSGAAAASGDRFRDTPLIPGLALIGPIAQGGPSPADRRAPVLLVVDWRPRPGLWVRA